MGLNIKNKAVEELAREVAQLTGESMTEAIRVALVERGGRLRAGKPKTRPGRVERWLKTSVWPNIPLAARKPLTKEEEEALLGYGPHGV